MSMIMPSILPLKVLSVDTSTARGSIALLEGVEVRAELRLFSPETHSARLLRSIEFLLESGGWKLSDLNLVAVGIGPGSFTGIRIGVSTALGLAQTLRIPFAGVSGLEALAHQVSYLQGRVGVVMDAQRSQVYYGEYLSTHGRVREERKPSLWHPADLRSKLGRRRLFLTGDASVDQVMGAACSQGGWPRAVPGDLFLAAGIGKLALARKRIWRTGEFLSCEPVYIRPPDAIRTRIGRS